VCWLHNAEDLRQVVAEQRTEVADRHRARPRFRICCQPGPPAL